MAAIRPARIALALVVGLASLVVVLDARANHLDVSDPNDVRGKLDIRTVQVVGSRKRPIWKVNTFQEWTNRDAYEHGFLLVFLDTFGNSRRDYYALMHSTGSRLTAELFRDRRVKRDYRISFLGAWRVNLSSASVRVPLSKLQLGGSRLRYTWYAQSVYFASHVCGRVCFDFAPNGREPVIEPRPDVTPSPSP